jgi:predicted metal-dependent phosphoesterase TrpH
MLIDMHIHTSKYSSCSILDPIDLVKRASQLRLSGIVITEHHNVWSHEEIEELKRETKSELLILRGQETTCSIGHLLIFGYYDKLQENLAAKEVLDKVHKKGGIVIMAHPFRNGHGFGEPPEELKSRFAYVDGIEVFNANQSRAENEFGRKVWEALGIVGIGGSDAHSVEMVGRYLTWFQNVIRNENDLVAEIRGGRCKPIVYDAPARL